MRCTVHHLMSRIAHSVYFLKDDQCGQLLEIVRRATEFCGLKLLGWCIMTNHFHLLVYLPEIEALDESEVVRRYSILKGRAAGEQLKQRLAGLRAQGLAGNESADQLLGKLKRRMYDVGEYMKIIKQWFSEWYNCNSGHAGTLWSATYKDKLVRNSGEDVSRTLAYINLNPVRAMITTDFDGYEWSSFTACTRGDALAESGLRFVYGDGATRDELMQVHREKMEAALGDVREEVAISVVRRRAAGVQVVGNSLTDEALVAQMQAKMKLIEQRVVKLNAELSTVVNQRARRRLLEQVVQLERQLHPEQTRTALARKYKCNQSTISRLFKLHNKV